LLTGRPAQEFPDRSPETIAQVVIAREVTPPSKWKPELKGDLEFILLKALRKDPRARYVTAEQFGEDLRAFLESRPVKARSGNTWRRMRTLLKKITQSRRILASDLAGSWKEHKNNGRQEGPLRRNRKTSDDQIR
jgi:hypothetical protein